MRILGIISPEKFAEAFNEWAQAAFPAKAETISTDGKEIRGAEHVSGQTLNIASALVAETGIVTGTQYCGGKGNEKKAFRELVDFLNVKGSIVVADALHCTGKSAESVIKAEADYLFVVKGNNERLHDELVLFFSDPPENAVTKYTTKEKNGGRIQITTQEWPSESDEINKYLCGLWNYEYPKQGCLPSVYTWVRKTVALSQIAYRKPYSKLSQKKISHFIALINSGISLPPLVCLNDELLDGFHRYQAYKKCGRNDGIDIYINS